MKLYRSRIRLEKLDWYHHRNWRNPKPPRHTPEIIATISHNRRREGETVCGPDSYNHGSNVRIRDKSTLRGVFDVVKLFAYCASDTVHIDKEGKPAAGIRCGLSCDDDRRMGIARRYLRARGLGSRPDHLIDHRSRRSVRHAHPLQRQSAARSSNAEFRPRRVAAQRTFRSILTPAHFAPSAQRFAAVVRNCKRPFPAA